MKEIVKYDLILIRGIPGSGKTTLAKTKFSDYTHIESDMYFMENGEYKFRAGQLTDAHIWCKWHTESMLRAGYKVVVSNTFTEMWELEYYIKLGYKTKIVDAKGNYESIHNIPENLMARMKSRYEDIASIYKKALIYNKKVHI